MALRTERPGSRGRYISYINVTPLVDVMLILFISYIVTAPMMQEGIDVRLPQVSASAPVGSGEPLVVAIDGSRRIYIGGSLLKLEELRLRLLALKGAGMAAQVLLKADRTLPYGFVAAALSAIRSAGIEKIGIVTEPAGPEH
ncbi:MAG: biopolymer transporter ExbD [Deltaproteobacteria bacterium]|nr:biopolymer transporter ExbD [Deltaproteobacteria bacterium]